MLGSTVSLLPFAMTAITIFSTLIFKNRHALPAELRAQKRNLYLMATGFLILFYPFPAGMVLFWTLANVLQTAQQQLVKN
jgi:membrane protein insertase Oxa1/YidC/SpoIIIJ